MRASWASCAACNARAASRPSQGTRYPRPRGAPAVGSSGASSAKSLGEDNREERKESGLSCCSGEGSFHPASVHLMGRDCVNLSPIRPLSLPSDRGAFRAQSPGHLMGRIVSTLLPLGLSLSLSLFHLTGARLGHSPPDT